MQNPLEAMQAEKITFTLTFAQADALVRAARSFPPGVLTWPQVKTLDEAIEAIEEAVNG